ncbi:aldo/keto reductase [bacterium]|nr:MAG: aldo/keto reductase [bacterium]
MRYNKLGRTGLFVSELCLGTMTFGSNEMFKAVAGVQQQEADTLVARSFEAGINFFDTADVYSDGQSEIITGKALRNLNASREEYLVATKVFGRSGKGPNGNGASRAHIMDGVKASLKRLELDHIDLYQIHGFDAATPLEETVRALDDLVRQGLVRYVGVSNWAAWQIMKALGISERLGLSRFDSLQAYYSIAGRDMERELIPLLNSEGVGLMVWSPLAGGFLSGKYTRDADGPDDSRRKDFDFPPVNKDRAFDIIDVMRPIAESRGVSVAQIALAWLLHQKVVSTVIIGAKRIEQLDDNLASVQVELSADELKALDEASQLTAEYPGWMIDFWGGERAKQLQASIR